MTRIRGVIAVSDRAREIGRRVAQDLCLDRDLETVLSRRLASYLRPEEIQDLTESIRDLEAAVPKTIVDLVAESIGDRTFDVEGVPAQETEILTPFEADWQEAGYPDLDDVDPEEVLADLREEGLTTAERLPTSRSRPVGQEGRHE